MWFKEVAVSVRLLALHGGKFDNLGRRRSKLLLRNARQALINTFRLCFSVLPRVVPISGACLVGDPLDYRTG